MRSGNYLPKFSFHFSFYCLFRVNLVFGFFYSVKERGTLDDHSPGGESGRIASPQPAVAGNFNLAPPPQKEPQMSMEKYLLLHQRCLIYSQLEWLFQNFEGDGEETMMNFHHLRVEASKARFYSLIEKGKELHYVLREGYGWEVTSSKWCTLA